jgi:hypothetical protein
METPGKFQLELAVDSYLQQLQLKGNYTPDDIEELKSHLLDEVDALQQKQLDKEEAFMVAKKRLGKEEVLNREYTKANGLRFYNRDLFITALSICTFLFLFYFYNLVTGAVRQASYFKNSSSFSFGITNYIFQFLFLGGILYLGFNSKKYIAFLEKYFVRSPENFSAIFIVLLVLIYFMMQFGTRMLHMPTGISLTERQSRFESFIIDNELKSTVDWLFPAVWMLAIFIAFTKSYKRINFLNYIVNDSRYIALFLLGVFWDFVAAASRMYNDLFINNEWGKAILFGVIWCIGMLIFSAHLKKNNLIRTIYFISFGFIMELAAGIWLNPKLRMGMPVSVYFITMVVGGALGLLLAGLIKQKQTAASA